MDLISRTEESIEQPDAAVTSSSETITTKRWSIIVLVARMPFPCVAHLETKSFNTGKISCSSALVIVRLAV